MVEVVEAFPHVKGCSTSSPHNMKKGGVPHIASVRRGVCVQPAPSLGLFLPAEEAARRAGEAAADPAAGPDAALLFSFTQAQHAHQTAPGSEIQG